MLDVAALQRANAGLRKQLAQLVSNNATLIEAVAKLNERVAELFVIAQRKQRKPSEPKPPPAPPIVEGAAMRPFHDLPKPPELRRKEKPTKARWMATNGTGLKVLVPELPAAHNGYIELYRNCECAVFQYEADKASEQLASKLPRLRGTLTADAEHRHNVAFASGLVLEAG